MWVINAPRVRPVAFAMAIEPIKRFPVESDRNGFFGRSETCCVAMCSPDRKHDTNSFGKENLSRGGRQGKSVLRLFRPSFPRSLSRTPIRGLSRTPIRGLSRT
jgi:hypothetical protein